MAIFSDVKEDSHARHCSRGWLKSSSRATKWRGDLMQKGRLPRRLCLLAMTLIVFYISAPAGMASTRAMPARYDDSGLDPALA